MKAKDQTVTRKLGANRSEKATHPRILDKNFKQSRDVREDRGQRKMKTTFAPRSAHNA